MMKKWINGLRLTTSPKHGNPNVYIDRQGFAPNDDILGQFLKNIDAT
jgi:hypothetical protein